MKKIDIYFNDVSEELQKEFLEAAGISDPKEANWDTFPVTTIEIYDQNGN